MWLVTSVLEGMDMRENTFVYIYFITILLISLYKGRFL